MIVWARTTIELLVVVSPTIENPAKNMPKMQKHATNT